MFPSSCVQLALSIRPAEDPRCEHQTVVSDGMDHGFDVQGFKGWFALGLSLSPACSETPRYGKQRQPWK